MKERISAFTQLGSIMGMLARDSEWPGFAGGLAKDEFDSFGRIMDTHIHTNGWFTAANIRRALHSWSVALTSENIENWLGSYPDSTDAKSRNVGIICAGNIPLVGFHDVLSVLITGNRALIKLSSSDNKLIPAILQILIKLDPTLENSFEFVEQKLEGYDAVIATGSNNTSRYFSYYFRDVPHIIRKSRTSVAILEGNESDAELALLGQDIFDYYGLGCRNVSKIYLPHGYNLDVFFNAIYPFHDIVNHNKYANNYDYNKAVWLLNQENLLDNGFILLKEENRIASPTASLYYEYYTDKNELMEKLDGVKSELQCIVGHGNIPFGGAQSPMLWDYADGVDTIQFLVSLHKQVAGR